jgi:hypothetical protein
VAKAHRFAHLAKANFDPNQPQLERQPRWRSMDKRRGRRPRATGAGRSARGGTTRTIFSRTTARQRKRGWRRSMPKRKGY